MEGFSPYDLYSQKSRVSGLCVSVSRFIPECKAYRLGSCTRGRIPADGFSRARNQGGRLVRLCCAFCNAYASTLTRASLYLELGAFCA